MWYARRLAIGWWHCKTRSVTSPLPSAKAHLTTSIVVYKSEPAVLRATVESLLGAIDTAREAGWLSAAGVDLIHNAEPDPAFSALVDAMAAHARARQIAFRLLEGHGNVGYGRGHNMAIA